MRRSNSRFWCNSVALLNASDRFLKRSLLPRDIVLLEPRIAHCPQPGDQRRTRPLINRMPTLRGVFLKPGHGPSDELIVVSHPLAPPRVHNALFQRRRWVLTTTGIAPNSMRSAT